MRSGSSWAPASAWNSLEPTNSREPTDSHQQFNHPELKRYESRRMGQESNYEHVTKRPR